MYTLNAHKKWEADEKFEPACRIQQHVLGLRLAHTSVWDWKPQQVRPSSNPADPDVFWGHATQFILARETLKG